MRTTPKGASTGEDDMSGGEEEEGGSYAVKGDRSVAWGAKLTKGVGHVSLCLVLVRG
jgi:hypothetical protein